jgi:hypothetical protein
MRKSPDGTREVIEMLVPIIGSRSRTFRVTGLGLSPKILIGAEDLPVATCLDITNRDVSGHLRYDMIETVRGGMMPNLRRAQRRDIWPGNAVVSSGGQRRGRGG